MYLVKYTRQYQADSLQGSTCYEDIYVEFLIYEEAKKYYEECVEFKDYVNVILYICIEYDKTGK